jgi:hypothetical protein
MLALTREEVQAGRSDLESALPSILSLPPGLHFPGLYAFDLIAMQPGEGSVIRADVER